MILFGMQNDTHVVASIAHHDYRSFGKDDQYIIHDGGQMGTQEYAGYSKCWGRFCCFEVPQDFSELYNDYQFNFKNREYGLWKKEDVRILQADEIPDVDSHEYLWGNCVWGTRGKDGKDPLKYVLLKDCEVAHLYAILDTQNPGTVTREACQYWIAEKSKRGHYTVNDEDHFVDDDGNLDFGGEDGEGW